MSARMAFLGQEVPSQVTGWHGWEVGCGCWLSFPLRLLVGGLSALYLAPVQGWLGLLEAQRGEMSGFLKV